MVRRVGCGDGERRAHERQERKDAVDAQAQRPQTSDPLEEERSDDGPSPTGRIILIVFLTVWICGWTVAIFMAITTWAEIGSRSGPLSAQIGLALWTIFAIVAWLFAARALSRLLSGESIAPRTRKRREKWHDHRKR